MNDYEAALESTIDGVAELFTAPFERLLPQKDTMKPLLDTCNQDDVTPHRHVIYEAWGARWCDCIHGCHVAMHAEQIDLEYIPMWWLGRISTGHRTACPDFKTSIGAPSLWLKFCVLAEAVAMEHPHEFSMNWFDFAVGIESPGVPLERVIAFYEHVGLIKVNVSSEQYTDGAGRWHDGQECGCTRVEIELITQKPEKEPVNGPYVLATAPWWVRLNDENI